MNEDDNERWLTELEKRIARIPVLRWYYIHVILNVCAYTPTPWTLFLVLVIHVCFILLIALPICFFLL